MTSFFINPTDQFFSPYVLLEATTSPVVQADVALCWPAKRKALVLLVPIQMYPTMNKRGVAVL